MKRCVAAVAVAVFLAFGLAWFETSGAAGSTKHPEVLHVGDVVRIAGTTVGCAVDRRSGAAMIECLPVSRSKGSYATLAGDKTVLVVRFDTPTRARTVFHAQQHNAHPVTCH